MTAKKKPTKKKSNSSSGIVNSKNLQNNKNNPFVNHQTKGKRRNTKDYSPQQLNECLKNYYKNTLKIKRLFYPDNPIPIGEHYITLSILPEGIYQNKLNDSVHPPEKSGEDFYDISSSLYGHEEDIISPEIIIPKCQGMQPRRVLVLGTAGIGKSTLSERLCYLWVEAEQADILKEYEWVFRIPLRNLTPERYSAGEPCSIITIIEKECLAPVFETEGTFLSQQDREVFETALSKATDEQKVLLILDGFDEISEYKPHSVLAALSTLLHFEQVVVTSRPYNLSELRQDYQFSANVSYEITGFAPPNIEQYVQDFFHYLPVEQPEAASSLLVFLKQNRNIKGICRIPINLELFCSAWEKQRIPQGHYSITTIYEVVTNSLCRRYLERKGEKIKNTDDDRIVKRCEGPLAFLEHLGYQSAYTGKLFFNISDTCRYIRKQLSISTDDNFVLEQKAFGFIRPNNPKGEFDGASLYYFNHLTFRDYFAARFLVGCLQQHLHPKGASRCYFEHTWPFPHEEALDIFLNNRQFDQRYEFIWWFMAGILEGAKDIKSLKRLLAILLADEDKVEISRFLMLIRFLDEASESTAQLPQGFWRYIEQWLHLVFEPFFNLLFLRDQSLLIERFRISPSVFFHDDIQSFFCEKIQNSEASIFHQILIFFGKLELPISGRIEEAIITRLLQLEDNINAVYQSCNLLKQVASLVHLGLLSVLIFIDKYHDYAIDSEESAILRTIFLYAKKNFPDNENEATIRVKMYNDFVDKNKSLFIRLVSASVLENFHEMGMILLLKQDKGYYTSLDFSNCFICDPDGKMNIKTVFFKEAILEDIKTIDLEIFMISQLIKTHICSTANFENIFLSERDKSFSQELNLFFCWVISLKHNSSPNDLNNLKYMLNKFTVKLMDSQLEDEAENFLQFLSLLFAFNPIILGNFSLVKKELLNLFVANLDNIHSVSAKKYLALSISCYAAGIPAKNYPKIFNIIINHSYSDIEIKKLYSNTIIPKRNCFFLVPDLTFCSQDCTSYLKDLRFEEGADSRSLFLLLNKTPTKAILNFSMRFLEEDSSQILKKLMIVLMFRYIYVGKAFYLNEEGICYFEYQKYQTYPLEDDQKIIFDNTFNQILKDQSLGGIIPKLSSKDLQRLSSSQLSKGNAMPASVSQANFKQVDSQFNFFTPKNLSIGTNLSPEDVINRNKIEKNETIVTFEKPGVKLLKEYVSMCNVLNLTCLADMSTFVNQNPRAKQIFQALLGVMSQTDLMQMLSEDSAVSDVAVNTYRR